MASTSKNLISYKTPLEKIDPDAVGGKGWNLFHLLRFGFSVPPWLVVSSNVFDEVIQGGKASINEVIANINFNDRKYIDHISSRIEELILPSEFPMGFSEELCSGIEDMFGSDALLSVRSSVVGEDSVENSFAGQMDSFLNVRLSGIAGAIKKVWASSFSPRALLYRHKKKIPLTNVSTAIIIQEMIPAASSGVLFTRDPETKRKRCLISAGYGLGEGVVSNKVETDSYWIEWDSDAIQKDVPAKTCRIVLNKKSQTGNQREPVSASISRQQVISDMQIQQLRDMGIRAEACFGWPQDIEWAFDDHRRPFLLQARPIVFAKDKSASKAIRIWDNSNIVESYPDVTLPLTFSFILKGYEHSFRKAALGFLVFKNEFEEDLHIFKNMIGLLEGRVYYNLFNWYYMLSYLPGFKKYKKSWDEMIGIKEKIDFPQNGLSIFNRLSTLVRMVWILLTARRNAKTFSDHFNSNYRRFQRLDISTATEEELIKLYEALERAFANRWYRTLYNDFCAIKYYNWLKQLCNQWGLEKYPNLHNNLLCGMHGIETVAPVRSLVRLVETFRTKPVYRALLDVEDDRLIWQKIQKEITYADLKASLEAHLEAFGDRSLEELKLERPTFREEPASLIRLIKNYFQLGLSIETMEKREQDILKNAEKILRQGMINPLNRLIFWFVLKNARRAIAYRENMRFARARLYGLMRRLFRRMADLFVEEGLIESKDDLYYLTVEEIFGFVQGTTVTQNLKALVEIRKAEYVTFPRRIPKERIQTYGIPYLNSIYETVAQNGISKILKGIGCSSGIAEGRAAIVLDPNSSIGNGEHILVARATDPGWVFLMISSKGIVVEKGSVLSHTAIIGRELGIPTIVGVKDATRLIPDGAKMAINGSTGEVQWQ